jgi:hypothetical protein
MCAFGTSAAVEISGRREKSKEGEQGTVPLEELEISAQNTV